MKGGQDGTKRRLYDRQLKSSASKLVIDEGMSVRELSEELGIKDTTLRRWSKEYGGILKRLFPVSKQYAEAYGKPDVILAPSVHPLTLVAGI